MNPEQEQFRASLHSLLDASDVPAIARAWAAGSYDSGLALWRKLSDLGVTALAIPPEYDGIGATPTDLVVAFEELGHHAVPGPAVESVAVLPTLLALAASGGDQVTGLAAEWLPRLASGGQQVAGLATQWLPRPTSGGQQVAGLAAEWLPRLASGQTLATLAWPPHVPFAVDAGVAALPLGGTFGEAIPTVDPTRHLSLPTASHPASGTAHRAGTAGESVPALIPLHGDGGLANAAAFDAGALACAAQLVGCGQALLEQSVGYVQQRVQFGQSIGGFQAVKHHLADVRIALDFARPLIYHAAESMLPQDISAAKVAAAEAANVAARHGLQVHGAIGYTLECDLSLWLVKVRALIPAWGTPSWHRNRLMELL